jgi:hypothetical protein
MDNPDLLASTGNNDSSSPWNGLLQTALQGGLSIGETALSHALGTQTPLTPTGNAPQDRTSPAGQAGVVTSNSGVWLLIAASVAAVVLIYFVIRGKA